MFNKTLLMMSMLLGAVNAGAATFYVAKSGNDNANGSSSSPFRTINRAMKANLGAGDQVVVREGIYKEKVIFQESGSAAGYITLRSEVPGGAKIDAAGNSAGIFAFERAYLKISGFEVYGSTGPGIHIMNSHHVQTLDNEVHHNVNAGIYFGKSDYILMEGNVAYANASQGPASGLAVKYSKNVTGNQNKTEVRIIVRNNVSYDNITKSGPETDGCGIIFDDFNHWQPGHEGTAYRFPSLVENNLVFGNSGRGIQILYTDNATIRNNTVYHNNIGKTAGLFHGELSNVSGSNNRWVNNIAVANPADGRAIAYVLMKEKPSSGVVWKNNLTFNGKSGDASLGITKGLPMITSASGNKLGVDPKFMAPSIENFRLHSSSTAIDAGTTTLGVSAEDIEGEARVQRKVDMGAYEQ